MPVVGRLHRYVLHEFIALALKSRAPLHIISGQFSVRTGGRFNYPGRHRTTYVSIEQLTAQVEAERIDAPYIHVPLDANLRSALNLADAGVARLLGLSTAELAANWRLLNARGQEAPTQELGHAVYDMGHVEGIIYPSTVHPTGSCVAVFPERLGAGSFVRIVDPSGVLAEQIP